MYNHMYRSLRVTVTINKVLSYLMYWCFYCSVLGLDPAEIPPLNPAEGLFSSLYTSVHVVISSFFYPPRTLLCDTQLHQHHHHLHQSQQPPHSSQSTPDVRDTNEYRTASRRLNSSLNLVVSCLRT